MPVRPEGKNWIRSYGKIWAPVITGFVRWVLSEAARRGTYRLYFLARDGYPMYQAAQVLTKGDERWDLRYLRVSRYALRIPEIVLSPQDYLERIFLCGIDVSMRKILRRGGLEPEEMAEVCRILGYHRPLDEILERREIRHWQAVAERNRRKLAPFFEKRSRAALETTRGYLIQECLAEDVPCALVDSGWVGSTQRSLERILGRRLEGYYFGLYDLPADVAPHRYHSYYFGPGTGIRRKARFSNCLFEAVCSDPAGMTLGYRREDQVAGGGTALVIRYVPVYEEDGNPNAAVLEQAIPVLIRYAEHIRTQAENALFQVNYREATARCERLLTRLMRYPTREEAAMFGGLLFSDDVLDEGSLQPVAARLDYTDIRELRLTYKLWHLAGLRRDHPIHESGWIYGSIVNCGIKVKRSLEAAERYQTLLYIRKEWKWKKARKL